MTEEIQHPPKGDNRYRVHRSVKCHLLEMMCGTRFCTLYISDSIERVVYRFPNGLEKVRYKNNYYDLQPAEKMSELVKQHLADRGGVNLSGKSLHTYKKDNSFTSYPFIDVTDADDRERYPKLRERWLKSEDFQKAL
jgi:hypothetical protein